MKVRVNSCLILCLAYKILSKVVSFILKYNSNNLLRICNMTIAKRWRQSNSLLINAWMNEMWYIHRGEYY